MITELDFKILDFIREYFSCSFLDFLMPKITVLGNGAIFWVLIAIGMLFSRRYRKTGIALAVGLLGCVVVGNLFLKNIFARERPCWMDDTVHMLIAIPRDYSFPSGHTMSSFAAAAVLAHASKGFGIFAYLGAILIAFSRLYLYVHFPSDVLGGMVIGTVVGVMSYVICERYLFRWERLRGWV